MKGWRSVSRKPRIPEAEFRLCLAVKAGDFRAAQARLNEGVKASCLHSAALNAACLHGRKDLVHLLMDHAANPYDCYCVLCFSRTPWWECALYWAAYRDGRACRYEMMPVLFQRKPRPPVDALQSALRAFAFDGRDPKFADRVGHRLIDLGVEWHGADRMLNGIHHRWMHYLISTHGANPEPRIGRFGGNALEEALEDLDVDAVRELLANGAIPDGVPKDHLYLADPDHAQVPEHAWQILRLLANAPGSSWKLPPAYLAAIL